MDIRGLWCGEVAAETTLVTPPVPWAAVRAPSWRSEHNGWTETSGGSPLELTRKRMSFTWNISLMEEDTWSDMASVYQWTSVVCEPEINMWQEEVRIKRDMYFLLAEEAHTWSVHFQIIQNFQNDWFVVWITVFNHNKIYINKQEREEEHSSAFSGMCLCCSTFLPLRLHSLFHLGGFSEPDIFHICCIT